MQRIVSFVLLLVLVSLIAAGSCFIVGRYTKNYRTEPAMGLHAVIHERLKLTKEQDKQLDPIEARFAEKRRHYAELIRIANTELADAIVADQADSPRVGDAVEKIHMAMGDLQKATLDHVFEMKSVLTPEQYKMLLALTAEGLRRQQ